MPDVAVGRPFREADLDHSDRLHPSLATRAGSRRAVAERLNTLLAAGLDAAALASELAEGARWSPAVAAEPAGSALGLISNF